jgi:CO/xanthine dehydrogenase FAD-binding subunit
MALNLSASAQLRNMASIGGKRPAAHALRVLSRYVTQPCNKRRAGQRLQRDRRRRPQDGDLRRERTLCIAVNPSDFSSWRC